MTKEEFILAVEDWYLTGNEDSITFLGRLFDEVTQPQWISVEDELPPYNKNVLVYDAEHPYFEFWWARRYAKGSGRLLDKNGFTTLTDDVNVTHWMYINPPITNPNLEDNSKKGGEE